MTLPKTVKIVEVGPRDGLQNEKQLLTCQQKVDFITQLAGCGLKVIEATSFVSPKWVPQMADSQALLNQLPTLDGITYPVLVPNEKGMNNALACQNLTEIAIFVSASESFAQKNTNCSIAQSIERLNPVMALAKQHNIKVRGYISCICGCPYEGDITVSNVVTLAQQLVALGCYEISLGDTIGVGTPEQVKHIINAVSDTVSMQQLAVHFHDTYGQALANIYAALQLGVSVIDCSVSGLGGCPYARGATGNVATEDVVYLLNGLNIKHGVDLDKLVQCGQFIDDILQRTTHSAVANVIRK